MNTLATRHPASRLPAREGQESLVRIDGDRQGSVFLIGSLVLHVGLAVAFAWLPSRAHASSTPEPLLEIEFVENVVKEHPLPAPQPEPEPEAALPQGQLNAPLNSAPAPSPKTSVTAAPETAEVSSAPEVLAVDNPYASANAAVFTSGSATGPSRQVVKHVAQTQPTFGVEGGSTRPSPDRTQELRNWYAKVQSQLARLGASNYPRRALKLGQQGTVKVSVTIDEAGNLLGVHLASGSGVSSLDQAAVQDVQSISKVAPPPSGAGTNRLIVPVTFRIN